MFSAFKHFSIMFLICLKSAFSFAQNDYVEKPPVIVKSLKAVESGNIIIDANFGVPYFWGAIAKQYYLDSAKYYGYRVDNIRNYNHWGVRVEKMLSDKFGLGVEYGYAGFRVEISDFYNPQNRFMQELKKQRFLVKFNFHFATDAKFDPYFNFGVGYRRSQSFLSSTSSISEKKDLYPFFPVALRTALGFRYFFNRNLGLNSEFGLGGPLLLFGLSYKI